jgi:uncharacterized protein YndB with AHSA1/START domain
MTPAQGEGTVEVSQRVVGTPDVVFPYFTDPEKYCLWQGLEAELDPRPGGIFRLRFFDGGAVEGEYLVVDPPRRLVFSWGWNGDVLPPGMADAPPGSTTVEITFVPDGDGTIIQLRHSGLPSDAASGFHVYGWRTVYLPRLEIVCAGGDPGSEPGPAAAREYARTGILPGAPTAR